MGGNLSKISRKGSKGERGEKGDTPNIEFKYENDTGKLSFRSNGIKVDASYINSCNIITTDNIVANTILEIVFKDEYIGDKTSQEICNACKAKKKIIGKLDNKTLNFSVIECDVNGNVSLKTLIDNETHEFICSSDDKWSKNVVSLVTDEDFDKAKEEQSKLISANADLISANTSAIAKNADLISNNANKIKDNKAATDTAIEQNTTAIGENKANILSQGTAITNLTEDVSDINKEVKTIGNSISGLPDRISTVEKGVGAAQENISSIQSIVQENLQSITNLQLNKLDKSIWEDFIKSGGTSGIIDLGTFAYEYDGDTGETIKDQTQEYEDAINSAIETGIYKVSWTEQGIVDTSVIIVMKCKDNLKNDYVLQIKFTPSMFHEVLSSIDDNPDWYGVIYTRAYGRNKWTSWQVPFERSFYKRNDMNSPDETTYPTTEAVSNFVKDYVPSQLYPLPTEDVPTTLKPNTEYNFRGQSALNLSFPVDTEDGDVICVRFMSTETPTNLVIDMSNVIDFELIPEKMTWYEICAKYDVGMMLWVLAYSEYSLDGE